MVYESNHSLILKTNPGAPFSARYSLEVKLSEPFVKFCKREKMSSSQRERFERKGWETVEAYGFKLVEDHQLYHWFDDNSAMLHHIRFPYGNATSLCYAKQSGRHSLDPHNVDTPNQQHCLAELASSWLEHMDYRIPLNNAQESYGN